MKADILKASQAELKKSYSADPDGAIQSLEATGIVDFANLGFILSHPTQLAPAGLHPSSGGDGTFVCPVEIMLAGWASCVGVTLAAVSHSMHLAIETCEIRVAGTIDFKGTLAVDRNAPVGLTSLVIEFQIQSSEDEAKIAKLVELTERYCVVHQTLAAPPEMKCNVTINPV